MTKDYGCLSLMGPNSRNYLQSIINEDISNTSLPFGFSKKIKLAILPFENLSKDDDSEFLVEGVFRDLITEFSRMQEFDVISHQTSLDFKKSNDDALTFAKKHKIDRQDKQSIKRREDVKARALVIEKSKAAAATAAAVAAAVAAHASKAASDAVDAVDAVMKNIYFEEID